MLFFRILVWMVFNFSYFCLIKFNVVNGYVKNIIFYVLNTINTLGLVGICRLPL